jgi:hypothetical protein
VELYLLRPDGSDQDYRNVPDAVFTANQAQIAQWVTAQGLTYYTDPHDDSDPATGTLLNLGQIQTWIQQQIIPSDASAEGPPVDATPPADAASSSGDGAVGVAVGVGLFALVVWALTKV